MGGPHGHPVLGALLAQRNCSAKYSSIPSIAADTVAAAT